MVKIAGIRAFKVYRLLVVICQVKNLKELIAFPKNIDGSCSLTGIILISIKEKYNYVNW